MSVVIHGEGDGTVMMTVEQALHRSSTVSQDGTACFTLDDPKQDYTVRGGIRARDVLKDGNKSSVTSMSLPDDLEAYALYANGSWNGVCKSSYTDISKRLEGGKVYFFPLGTETRRPIGFRFLAAGQVCTPGPDGQCKIEMAPIDPLNPAGAVNDALDLAQKVSRAPCDYFACNDGLRNVLDKLFTTEPSAIAEPPPLPDLVRRPCDRLPCTEGMRNVLAAVPGSVYATLAVFAALLGLNAVLLAVQMVQTRRLLSTSTTRTT